MAYFMITGRSIDGDEIRASAPAALANDDSGEPVPESPSYFRGINYAIREAS
jgi:hypothetical protein